MGLHRGNGLLHSGCPFPLVSNDFLSGCRTVLGSGGPKRTHWLGFFVI